MKDPAAFLSYARRDDRAFNRRITGIRTRLQGLVGAAIGRDFEIFQDCEGIAWGQHWRSRLAEALDETLFLIPILTPSYFNSKACRTELEAFLELERRSGRKDRILPLYFLDAPVYEKKADPLAALLQERQHRDWRHLLFDPLGSAKVMRTLDSLARELAGAIHARQTDVSPPAAVSSAPETTAVSRGSEVAPPPVSEEPSTALRETNIHVGDTLALPDSTVLSRPETREPGTVFRDIDAPWCPELVVISAGSFVMGSPETEAGCSEPELPQHLVTFASPFALGRYPVTFEEYDHFCSNTGREKSLDWNWGRGRQPVINVSWEDAQAYCLWLGRQTGQRYRLPSEAEWEYSCRAGTTTRCWTGTTISTEQANFGGIGRQTTPVDTFEANPWGLYDMLGNIWEWVEDCWNVSYSRAPRDGSAWTAGDCNNRVLRGGSWSDFPLALRSAQRLWLSATYRSGTAGFRVARTLTH